MAIDTPVQAAAALVRHNPLCAPTASQRDGAYEPLVPVTLAAIAGIALDRMLDMPAVLSAGTTLTALLAWFVLRVLRRDRSSAIAVLLAVSALAAAWHHVTWRWFAADDLAAWAVESSRPVCVEVVALDQARLVPPAPYDPLRIAQRGPQTRLTVSGVRLRDGDTWCTAGGRAALTIEGQMPDIAPGDRLRLWGTLACPAPPGNPGEFDFAAHERAERRLCRLNVETAAAAQLIERGSAWRPDRWMARTRQAADRFLVTYLPSSRSGLASALLLGLRDQVGRQRTSAYLQTGTIHVLSISGMHIAIVAGTLFGLLRLGWIPQRAAAISIGLITVLYAWLAGAEPPVVRAAVLVGIACLAMVLGRRALSWNGLAAAALIVLAANPSDLFRVGPQLSFLCVGALIWFGPRTRWAPPADPLDRLIWDSRPAAQRACRAVGRWIWQLTVLGFWVWLVSLPLVAARFHLVSPLAPLLNTAIWMPVTLVLIAGLSLLVAALVLPPAAVLVAGICAAALALMDAMVAWSAHWPGSHFWVPGPSDAWLIVLYGALACWALAPRWRPRRGVRLALVVAWIFVGLVAPSVRAATGWGVDPWGAPPAGALRCTFLDVGHGCAVVVELPNGQTLVYDAGQLGSPTGAAAAVSGLLWQGNRRRIDLLALSHADVDHFNGVPELLDRLTVARVIAPPGLFAESGAALVDLQQALRQAGLKVETVSQGWTLDGGGGCTLEALHPRPSTDDDLASENAQSLVMAIEFQGRRVLLTGDLEGAGVEALLQLGRRPCDVMLAPHHGSARSDPPGLAAWSTPRWLIASGGRQELAPEFVSAYAATGARVLHTATAGAVQVTIDAQGLTVRTWRNGLVSESSERRTGELATPR